MTWRARCVDSGGYDASLEPGRTYDVIRDDDAEYEGMIRIVDESGESYLYPRELFAADG